jgi:hypothetical protein
MAKNLEIKRAEVEIARIKAVRLEMELKIDERMEEIERMREHMKLQEDRIAELEAKILAG